MVGGGDVVGDDPLRGGTEGGEMVLDGGTSHWQDT